MIGPTFGAAGVVFDVAFSSAQSPYTLNFFMFFFAGQHYVWFFFVQNTFLAILYKNSTCWWAGSQFLIQVCTGACVSMH